MEAAIWPLMFLGVCNLIVTWVEVNDQHKHFSTLRKRLIEMQNYLADTIISCLNYWLYESTGKDKSTNEPDRWKHNNVCLVSGLFATVFPHLWRHSGRVPNIKRPGQPHMKSDFFVAYEDWWGVVVNNYTKAVLTMIAALVILIVRLLKSTLSHY